MKKRMMQILCVLLPLALLAGAGVMILNEYVKHTAQPYLLTPEEAAKQKDLDCILILGCGVRPNGQPSLMLRDRLEMGLSLYKDGTAPKLLMSGDHGQAEYDEVNVMKDYAVSAGVPSEDVFMDHAGFSTYESMYRANAVFQVKRVIIVSQQYHLYRAVYDARALGLEAWGVAAEDIPYLGQTMRDLREILARNKDVFFCLTGRKPTFLGEPLPICGNGDLSNG